MCQCLYSSTLSRLEVDTKVGSLMEPLEPGITNSGTGAAVLETGGTNSAADLPVWFKPRRVFFCVFSLFLLQSRFFLNKEGVLNFIEVPTLQLAQSRFWFYQVKAAQREAMPWLWTSWQYARPTVCNSSVVGRTLWRRCFWGQGRMDPEVAKGKQRETA